MEIKRGIAVSPGVAIGPALILDSEWFRIPQRQVTADHREGEVQRLRLALKSAAEEARQTQDSVSSKLGNQYGAIFAAHAMLLTDPNLAREVESLIRDQSFAAEYAVSRVMRRYAKALESMRDGYGTTRVADLFDIEKRLLGHLLGQKREELRDLSEAVVVLAHDLMPSETANLDPRRVHAFATEAGGRTSHTAIVAGMLEIPAVVGLGSVITDVSGGDLVIVDGHRGILILNPDEETRERYEQTQHHRHTFESRL
jgi:phosphotransferase system enzyme I (PtsI)